MEQQLYIRSIVLSDDIYDGDVSYYIGPVGGQPPCVLMTEEQVRALNEIVVRRLQKNTIAESVRRAQIHYPWADAVRIDLAGADMFRHFHERIFGPNRPNHSSLNHSSLNHSHSHDMAFRNCIHLFNQACRPPKHLTE